jgi:ketosteroid isomerase-like protein
MLATLLAAALAAGADPADTVRAADLAMARAVDARDAAAFEAWVDAEAIFVGDGRLLRGRRAVADAWRVYFAPAGPRLAWAPERVEVAASGDLAFTTGRFVWEGEVRPGERGRVTGAYVTVWRRGEDGSWRALFDASLEPAERLGPGLVRDAVRTVSSAGGELEAKAGTWTRGAERGAFVTVSRRAASGAGPSVDTAVVFRGAGTP